MCHTLVFYCKTILGTKENVTSGKRYVTWEYRQDKKYQQVVLPVAFTVSQTCTVSVIRFIKRLC